MTTLTFFSKTSTPLVRFLHFIQRVPVGIVKNCLDLELKGRLESRENLPVFPSSFSSHHEILVTVWSVGRVSDVLVVPLYSEIRRPGDYKIRS